MFIFDAKGDDGMKVYRAEDVLNQGKSISVLKSSLESRQSLHSHEFIEIVYILSGKAKHTIDGCTYHVTRGDLLFMNYGCTHEFSSEKGFQYVNVLFSAASIADTIATPAATFSLLSIYSFDEMRNEASHGKLSFIGEDRLRVEWLIEAMLREHREKERAWESAACSYLGALLVEMMRKNERGVECSEMLGIWRELEKYVEDNLADSLSPSALAEKFFYNPSYFSRLFKERFGVSPSAYIMKRRTEYAAKLLRETSLSINEIAERAGFADRGALYTAYSRYYGTTPAKDRSEKNSKKSLQ